MLNSTKVEFAIGNKVSGITPDDKSIKGVVVKITTTGLYLQNPHHPWDRLKMEMAEWFAITENNLKVVKNEL